MKEDTSKLKETVSEYVGLPFALAGKGREYVLGTWRDEYGKTKGEGVVRNVRALISTELKIGMDGYTVLVEYWQKGHEEARKKVHEVSAFCSW